MRADIAPRSLLVTGGAGFIGLNLVHYLARALDAQELERVVVLDAFTYAGHEVNLAGATNDPRLEVIHGDIGNARLVAELFGVYDIDSVIHLAAESHVDRSIDGVGPFVRTNVLGTVTLLDAALQAWKGAFEGKKFVHVSTDEVYGALGPTGVFTEDDPYLPNSPYAASKGASDLMARSYAITHKLPVVTTHGSNTYGPRQLPEKLIPLMITRAIEGERLPVYGRGLQVRDWMHVDDHARGLFLALMRGVPGETYNLGGGTERRNIDVVHAISDHVDSLLGRPAGSGRGLIRFVEDRPAHDFRYALSTDKARRALGYHPRVPFAAGLLHTIDWYLDNHEWRAAVKGPERVVPVRPSLRQAA